MVTWSRSQGIINKLNIEIMSTEKKEEEKKEEVTAKAKVAKVAAKPKGKTAVEKAKAIVKKSDDKKKPVAAKKAEAKKEVAAKPKAKKEKKLTGSQWVRNLFDADNSLTEADISKTTSIPVSRVKSILSKHRKPVKNA